MASKTEGEPKVTTCCLRDIKSQIAPEKVTSLWKRTATLPRKELRLKTMGEKKDLIIATWKVS